MTGGGNRIVTKGYSRPFAPSGSASVVEALPWRFAGDLLLIHFSADPEALSALLPTPLEPADNPSEAFLWSPHLRCYPESLSPDNIGPARTHYNVAVIGVPCKLNGQNTMYSAFQWGDKDWLVVLSWFLGACSKMGEFQQSGTHPMLPQMNQDFSPGTHLQRSVSRHGEKLINMSFIPSEEIELTDMEFYLKNLPLTCERHFPDCHVPPRGRPLVHDLTQMIMTNTEFGTILKGDANLSFYDADNEELIPLQPKEVYGGYWLPMGFMLEGIKTVYDYLEQG